MTAARGRWGGYRWAQSAANSVANVEALQFLVDLTWRDHVAPAPPRVNAITVAFTDAIDRAMNPWETPQAALDRLHTAVPGILNT